MLEALSQHPFLAGMTRNQLAIVAENAQEIHFDDGQLILREGDTANTFFLLKHGKVRLEIFASHGQIIIETLEVGEVLGWSWFVPPYRWRFDARAMGLVRAIAVDGDKLRDICEQNHELGYHLFKRFSLVIAERLETTRWQVLDVYGGR